MLALLRSFLTAHPYLALAPMVLVEGPLATILAGALVATGALVWPAALALAVSADLAADCGYYALGRKGQRPWARAHLRRPGLDDARQQRLSAALATGLPQALIGAEVADLGAVPTMLAAGFCGVALHRFLTWNGAITVVKSSALLTVGVLFAAQVVPLVTPTSAVAVLAAVLASALLARAIARRKVSV